MSSRSNKVVALWIAVVLVTVAIVSRTWVEVTSHYVPEPYLDEVFHVPQAQKYCEGRFNEWDDKITTPPGLYALSLLIPKNLIGKNLSDIFSCDTTSLRGINALALTALANLALLSRWQIEARLHGAQNPTKIKAPSKYAIHSALNIALCPIIFFFSGLYYTDVASTAVVLAAFLNSLQRMGKAKSSLLSDFLTIFLGILALLMRQTNVFWVVVFIGGLEAIHAVKTLRPQRVDQPSIDTVWEKLRFFGWRYAVGDIHDIPSREACEDDMLLTAVSLITAAICNPIRILRQLWPYITVLVTFISFITWNGGVVLGDKSNHVATVHLAQMLYLWPLFSFFSLPLLLPNAVQWAATPSNFFRLVDRPPAPQAGEDGTQSCATGFQPSGSTKRRTIGKSQTKDDQEQHRSAQRSSLPKQNRSTAPRTQALYQIKSKIRLVYILATISLSIAIVRFNTIIHPFTLADNRHYIFYIFRYTIRRSSGIRYSLVMIYTISRWMVWGTLCGCSGCFFGGASDGWSKSQTYSRLPPYPFMNHPYAHNSGKFQPKAPLDKPHAPESEEIRNEKQGHADRALRDDPLRYSTEPVPTSTTLVFLLATTLSLITAPLVEPRYFIIPWVIWRLLIPAWRYQGQFDVSPHGEGEITGSLLGSFVGFCKRYDLRLILETVWFIAINLGTIYIFLFKPYQWRTEDGELLDDGRWQRFMW